MIQNYKSIRKLPRRFIPIMFLAALSANLLSLALPLTMKQIYSNVIVNQSMETLNLLMIGCLVALIFESILRYVKEASSKWIAAKYEYQLNAFYTKSLLNTPLAESDLKSMQLSLQDFSTITKLTSFYATKYYQVWVDIPFMFLFFYLIYYIGGTLVFVPLSLSAVYIVWMLWNSRSFFKYRAVQMNSEAEIMDVLMESLEKIHFVKASGIENLFIRRYEKRIKENSTNAFMLNHYQAIPNILGTLFSQAALFAILLLGGYEMIVNQITFGEVTACALIGGRAVAPIQSVMQYFMQRKDVELLNGRLNQLAKHFEIKPRSHPRFPEDIVGRIEISKLRYTSCNQRDKSLSLVLETGSLTVIRIKEMEDYKLFFKQITGKVALKYGRVLIDDLDISKWDMTDVHGKIEVVDEQVKLFKGTIIENITYFDKTKYAQAYETMSITGLSELVSSLPEGTETILDSGSENRLSASFLQRLNLTRALVDRPRILCFDRVDENMDFETLEIFIGLLKHMKKHITVLIVSDNMDIQELADQVL